MTKQLELHGVELTVYYWEGNNVVSLTKVEDHQGQDVTDVALLFEEGRSMIVGLFDSQVHFPEPITTN